MTGPLRLSVDASDPGYTLVRVEGEVDVGTAATLRRTLVEVGDTGVPRIVVDLQPVEFLDSTGLGVLIGALKRLRSRDGDVELVCDRLGILRVFELTGLATVFTIHQSIDDVTTRPVAV